MYTYPKRKKFENLNRRTLKHSYLILSLLFLPSFIFTIELTEFVEDLLLFSLLSRYSNVINRFSHEEIQKEEERKPAYLPVQQTSYFKTNVETLMDANWTRWQFEKFKGSGNFTKDRTELAANFYKILTDKYEAYSLIKDKKGKNYKAAISKKESDYVMTARSFARQWPNSKLKKDRLFLTVPF